MKMIDGGVTAPKGFLAAGLAIGIKANKAEPVKDLALIYSEKMCGAAAVYTKNKFKAPPLQVTEENLKNNQAQAILINSGCANAATGTRGKEDALRSTELLARELGINKADIVVASTGVIGVFLPMDKIEEGLKDIKGKLSPEGGREASQAIMTTDTISKEVSCQVELGGKQVKIGGMAKGSGMIHPDMATMLAFITSDVKIKKESLQPLLKELVDDTFNMISVDGDTSTNDMVCLLANGMAENEELNEASPDFLIFKEALAEVCKQLALAIVRDGEGATKLISIEVKNALTKEDARRAVRSISTSNLVKTAFFGQDANWGRIITALGYSGAQLDPDKCNLFIGDMQMAKDGQALSFSEEKALEILKKDEITLVCDLGLGKESATGWTCDLSYDYVKINADYRS